MAGDILFTLQRLFLAAAGIALVSGVAGVLIGRFLLPRPGRVGPGPPPPMDGAGAPAPVPVLAAVDAVLAYALGELWVYLGARERAGLRGSLWLLQEWARRRWPLFPVEEDEEGNDCHQ